jgi:uncharacterized protein
MVTTESAQRKIAEDARCVSFEPLVSDGAAAGGSHYERSHIATCEVDQSIARLVASVAGHAEPPNAADRAKVKLGRNVAWGADGATVVAKSAGRVCVSPRDVRVEPVLAIDEDVDFSTGNINFHGDVIVGRNVLDLFKISSTTDIVIHGFAEGAEIHAGHDLHVHGGITGKGKGRFHAGNDISAKYIANAHVEAGNNISAHNEIANSDVTCAGKILGSHCTIMAGQIKATAGVECHTVGSPAGVRTVVEIGFNHLAHGAVCTRLHELEEQKKVVGDLRARLEPLIKNQRNLCAKDKERMTEINFEISEAEAQLAAIKAELKAACEAARARPRTELSVSHGIHPGVTVRFPGLETTINSFIKGPVKILAVRMNGEKRILQMDPLTKNFKQLPTATVSDQADDFVLHVISEHLEEGS